jgi:hypothetical protein
VAKRDDEIIEKVTKAIEEANATNRRHELLELALLVILFFSGMTLLLLGAGLPRWELLVPGSIVQLMTIWPLRQIAKLREDKMRLRIVLQLMRLATSKEAKVLAAQLVRRLIEQV